MYQGTDAQLPPPKMDTRLGWLVLAAILRVSSVVGGTPAADVNSVFIEGSSQFAGFRFEPTSHMEAMAGAHTRTPPPPPPPANGTITVSVGSGTTLPAGGAWVNVTTTCTPTTAGWWVGLFPAETASIVVAANPADPKLGNNTGSPFTPPFVLPAPLKFVGGCGLVREWWVPDVRQPLAFVLMSGGTSGGTSVERARTSRLTHGSPGHPMHVRLGRTALSTEMRVSWTSASIVSPTVRWGNSPSSLTNLASASSTTYTSSDLCGEPARTLGWFDPGWHHTTVLDLSGSPPGTTLYYAVSSAGMATPTRQFRVPSIGPQTTLRVVLTADMGATAIDKASQHWAEAQACVTTASMAAWAAEKQADLAFNVGDLSYATGYLGKWETFMSAIEPLSATVPYVVAQGNHEQDWPGTGAVTNGPLAGRDSGGECGVPAASRFMVGSSASSGDPKPISYWYAFDAGPVHFVVVNTEISSLWNGTQYQWLESDLTRVNRSETPWIVMMGHRNEFDGRRDQFEDLMYRTQVDLTVAGHVHYARQSCPMYKGVCRAANVTGGFDGIVHVVAGNGGQALNNATRPTKEHPYGGSGCNWTDPSQNCTAAKKVTGSTQGSGSEFGMSYFEVNATTLTYSFVGNNDSKAHYTFQLSRAFPRPRLSHVVPPHR